jgi:hypothetical protein
MNRKIRRRLLAGADVRAKQSLQHAMPTALRKG